MLVGDGSGGSSVRVFWAPSWGFDADCTGSGKGRCRNDLGVILRPLVAFHDSQKVSSFHQRLP